MGNNRISRVYTYTWTDTETAEQLLQVETDLPPYPYESIVTFDRLFALTKTTEEFP